MDYNSNRKKLALPEYGRNIQIMVDYLATIEDRDKRNRSAQTVIDVMGNLFPHLRDVEEFRHKLWDHLAIMSNFKLDIDYPYEPPTPDILVEKPNKVPYDQHPIKIKQYGLVVEKMIEYIAENETEERELLIELLLNQMKKLYLSWNKDSVEDEKIFSDLEKLSKGRIKVDREIKLADARKLIGKPKKKKQKSNKRH